jgi:hypothetical protein
MSQALPPHLLRILDLARWAPSGDNTQPWRFEILGEEHILVHGFDTRDHVVYDLDGHASQLAHGALLETLAIAATLEGYRAVITRRPDTPETTLLYDVRLQADHGIQPDPLAAVIETRTVQRRAMSTQALSGAQKQALEAVLPKGYRVVWFEGLAMRWKLARFMFDNAKVRLTIPEAYEVHKSVIEWGAQFSEDRIPEQAVGVDPLTARFMRWAMASWSRVEFFNKWLMGTVAPRIQLDLIPGLRCGAHFALLADKPLRSLDAYVEAGRAMQRFWLTAAKSGLHVQPEMTPVIFTRYVREGVHFSSVSKANEMVTELNGRLHELLAGEEVSSLYFIGRTGMGSPPKARSLRHPLGRLLLKGDVPG